MTKLEILYVEDNPGDAALLCEQFRRENTDLYHLNHTPSLTDALELLKAQNFNAILLDLNLPDGDGINNIETLKSIRSDIPIVILTGMNDEKKAEEALLKGAQEYIVKNDATCAIIKRILQSSILRQKAEIALVHKAHHDQLTDLPNRAAFEETATMLIKRAQRWDRKEALMFIDLNKFKEINDTYGHEAGNAVLVEVSKRLKKTLRQSDLIARYAGDEFVVYLDSNQNLPVTEELCALVADKVINGVEEPFCHEGNDIKIGLSMGIAIFPDAGETFESLLKAADSAMYRAKKDCNKNYAITGSNQIAQNDKKPLSYKDIQNDVEIYDQKTILLIDNSKTDRSRYKKILKSISKNYQVLESSSIIEARKKIEKQEPDCIILDYNLPDMNGLNFLKETTGSQTNNIAVIIATDQDDRAAAVRSMQMGAHDYLVKKEINKNCLSRALSNAIEKNDLNRQLNCYQEKLEQSNEELTEFAHTVAHDLKAPLRRIYTFCDMLEMQNDIQNEDTKNIINRMSVNALRLQTLIDNLLVYAQIMNSREEKKTTCLTTLINDVLEDLEIPLKEKNVSIRMDKLPNLPVYPVRMRQLFLNLIINSIKYSRPNITPIIDITREINENHCVISITDNGMGMTKDKLKQIFKPFFRLHSNDQIEGTGLGLSICQKVVKKHDGKIWAESREGQGTAFKIVLPLDIQIPRTVEHQKTQYA